MEVDNAPNPVEHDAEEDDNAAQEAAQSKFLNVINELISQGQLTHILNVKLLNHSSGMHSKMNNWIKNQNHQITVGSLSIKLTWSMRQSTSSCYYYTNSIYNDSMTERYTTSAPSRSQIKETAAAFIELILLY
jgi:hypothetical protein